MKLSQIGEFGLIERLAKLLGKPPKPVVVGIGDDAAVLEKPKYLLVTTDTLIENVHFKLGRASSATTYINLGYKAMAVNISDIAAMGGEPTYALVTIGAPKEFSVKAIEDLYRGLKKHGIPIIGGDTVQSPKELVINVVLLGEVEKECLLLRSGARVGDYILVTGKFGGQAAAKFDSRKAEKPKGRLKEARMIAKTGLASSMIDSSDGLVCSIREICKASKVDARIDFGSVPVAKGATFKQALFGGEEYELVFTVSKSKAVKLAKLIPQVSIVGRIVRQGKGNLPKGGYEHFK